jgi:hypothetical protein
MRRELHLTRELAEIVDPEITHHLNYPYVIRIGQGSSFPESAFYFPLRLP